MAMANSRDEVRIVAAKEASWDDLQEIFSSGEGRGCQCQFFKLNDEQWRSSVGVEERAERLLDQAGCGNPQAPASSGLIAYCEGEPAAWCAVEPRTAYPRLLKMRVPWAGREENKADAGIWAVTCFVVRRGYRRRGIASALAGAAVGFARDHGAHAIEGYPRITRPGDEFGPSGAYLYVGSRNMFAAAGFCEVSRPTPRRAVMRVDF